MQHGVLCLATVIPPNGFDDATGSTMSSAEALVQESAHGAFPHSASVAAAAAIAGHVRVSLRSALDALHDANQAPHITPRRGSHQAHNSNVASSAVRGIASSSTTIGDASSSHHLPASLVFDVPESALLRCCGRGGNGGGASQPGEVHAVFRRVQTHLSDDDLFLDCSFFAKQPTSKTCSQLLSDSLGAANITPSSMTDEGCVMLHGSQLRQAFLDCDTAESASSLTSAVPGGGRHAAPLCRWKHLLCKTLELHDKSVEEDASTSVGGATETERDIRNSSGAPETPRGGTLAANRPPALTPRGKSEKKRNAPMVGLLLHFVAVAFSAESVVVSGGPRNDGTLSPYAVGSRSPSNISSAATSAETSSSTTTASGSAAHRHHHARRPIAGATPSYLWDPALWLQLMSVHQQQMQRVVYAPTMDILERQFEAAVDELLTVESTLQREVDERDLMIAQLVEEKKTAMNCDESLAEETEAPARPTRALTPPPPSSPSMFRSAEVVNGSGRTPARGESKQKDMEIFLLRARLSATEAARQAEVDELRREIAALKKGRESVLRKETGRLLLLRKRAAAAAAAATATSTTTGAAAPSTGGTSAAALYRPSARHAVVTGAARTNSASGVKSAPSAVAAAGAVPSVRHPSPSQGRLPSPTSAQARRSNSRGNASGEVPQSGFSTHHTSKAAQHQGGSASAGSAAVASKLGAAERDERLRRLEESYVKLQIRNTAVLSSIAAAETDGTAALGGAAASTTTTKPVTETSTKSIFVQSSGSVKSAVSSGGPATAPTAGGATTAPSTHTRRTISPLRIPVKVPGLKAIETPTPSSDDNNYGGGSAPSSRLGGGVAGALGFSGRSHSRHQSPSAQRSYDSAAATVPSSVLRTSPLRMTESLSKLRLR